jgi:hypothetical protein
MYGTRNIILNEVNEAQKARSCMFSLISDPPQNAAILWEKSHAKGRLRTGKIGQGKEIRNLNVLDVLMVVQE